MTEQEFLDKIEEATGMKIADDYGFIMGTQHPLGPAANPGLQTASKTVGFITWKRTKLADGEMAYAEEKMTSEGIEKNCDNVIAFLKKPYTKDA